MKKSKKNIVYSTNPDFSYEYETKQEGENLPNNQQHVKIFPDRKNRAGKTVTVISGYKGSTEDVKALEKSLKGLCGCGGTVKEGNVLLQGNFIQKVSEHLKKEGFHIKISGI
jgi:translation initiation factor 1